MEVETAAFFLAGLLAIHTVINSISLKIQAQRQAGVSSKQAEEIERLH